MKQYVELTIRGNVAHLELTRTRALNALNRVMVDQIFDAIDVIEENETVRVLTITGRGTAFCVGGDLNHFANHINDLSQELECMIAKWHSVLLKVQRLPFVVIVGIHGGCAGGGLGLVWVADHVVAAEDTKIALGFADVGLTGDSGCSWYLPRLIGIRRSKELLIENRVLDAGTALNWGLINQVVSCVELSTKIREKAQSIISKPSVAIAGIKRNLIRSFEGSFQDHLDIELKEMIECSESADVKALLTNYIKNSKQ